MKDSAYTETPNDTICRQPSGLKYREESQQTLDLDTLLIQLFIQDDWHNQWINKIALSFKQQLALICQAYAFLLRYFLSHFYSVCKLDWDFSHHENQLPILQERYSS